ncbi:MAG: hypothetical protein JW782_05305 [Candidatus Saganbacteria bacterium]|nr:hypothetical protein [Candidatus Saganbacteria bacterium]
MSGTVSSIVKFVYVNTHRAMKLLPEGTSKKLRQFTSLPGGRLDTIYEKLLKTTRAQRFQILDAKFPGWFKNELLIKVDENGVIEGVVPKPERSLGGVFAVALIAMINSESGNLVLFERGKGAQDMKGVFALSSGSMNAQDLADARDSSGKITYEMAEITAKREISEELGADIDPDRLIPRTQFHMPKKGFSLFFTLFTIKVTPEEIEAFQLSGSGEEVISIKEYSAEQLATANDIGHALQYRRSDFVELIQENKG